MNRRQSVTNLIKNTHSNFIVVDGGLFLSSAYPYLRASPNSIVSCSCCGVGCLEIKCPYCDREKSIDNIVQKSSCIEKVNDSDILKENHQYFYQIQVQLLVTNYEYCDLFYGQKLTTLESELYLMMLCKWKLSKCQESFF